MSDGFPADWDRPPTDFPGPTPTSFPARRHQSTERRDEPEMAGQVAGDPTAELGQVTLDKPPTGTGVGDPAPPQPQPQTQTQPQWAGAPPGGGHPPGGGYPPAYQPPYQPPYQPEPTGPPPKVRTRPMIWPWLLGALLVIVLGIGGCVAVAVRMGGEQLDATNSFVAALDEGRLDDAYTMLCADTRAAVTPEVFRADHRAAGAITGYTFVTLSAMAGESTTVSGTVEIDDVPRTVAYSLRQEAGQWRVCSYQPLI